MNWDDPNTENSFEPPFDVPNLSKKLAIVIIAGLLAGVFLLLRWLV